MTKVNGRQSLPALDNSKSVNNPDLLNIADKNYTSTIMRYSNLAILYSQLETDDKHIVGAINEINRKIQPAKKVGETTTIGGIIVGDGLDITEKGVLSANAQGLTPATSDKLGGIMVGENLSITEEGVLSADAQELEPATADRLGGVKLGDYLNITEDGTISVESSAVGKTYYSGTLTTIDNQNKINVNMTKSTPADIEQASRDNPNVLFFTEGTAEGLNVHTATVTINSNNWDDNTNAVTLSGITTTCIVLVSPLENGTSNYTDYCDANVRLLSQATNILTFKCDIEPSNNLSANVMYWNTDNTGMIFNCR